MNMYVIYSSLDLSYSWKKFTYTNFPPIVSTSFTNQWKVKIRLNSTFLLSWTFSKWTVGSTYQYLHLILRALSSNRIKPFSIKIKILFVKRNAKVKFYPYEWPRCTINLILCFVENILFPEERSFLISRIFLLDWKVHALMTVPANQNGFIALSPR